jgi:CHAD domain-containing protein
MGFHFERDEPIDVGVRRIANERLLRVRESIASTTSDTGVHLDEVVHRVRTTCKELRGLLRLVEEPLDDEFAVANGALRRAGREVEVARERDAMLACHDELVHALPPAVVDALTPLRDEFVCAPGTKGDVDTHAALLRSDEHLAHVAARVADWPLASEGLELVAPGFERSYARARRAERAARRVEDGEPRHEWRKRAKVHWYHLRLFRPVWPALFESLAGEAKRLTEALGLERDLSLLRTHIASRPAGESEIPSAYLDELATRRERAISRAERIGRRLFASDRRTLREQLDALWRAWRR